MTSIIDVQTNTGQQQNEVFATDNEEQEPVIDENVDGPRITLIAIGGAAIALSGTIDKSYFRLHEIIAIDTNQHRLSQAFNAQKTLLIRGEDSEHIESAELIRNWATQNVDVISEIIGEPHLAIILADLNEIAGEGLAAVVAQTSRGKGTPTFAFVCPAQSEEAFLALQGCTDHVLAFPKQKDNPAPRDHAPLVRQALNHYLWNTCACVTHIGMVGIDFEDVLTVFGMENRLFISMLAWGEAAGIERAKIAVQQALGYLPAPPTLNHFLYSISVSIRGKIKTLKLHEINTIMNDVKTLCGQDDALMIFSGDFDDSLDERIQISIISNFCELPNH